MGRYVGIQTIEEFIAEVKRQFCEDWSNLSKEEVEAFFSRQDIANMIKKKFADGYDRLKQGKITQRVFDEGTTSSIANCLILMYE